MPISIPNSYVNPNVRHVGVSKLRLLNASKLRSIKTWVIQENEEPLAVLVKYEDFLKMQEQLVAASATQFILSDKLAAEAVASGRADARAGNTRSIEEVRESLKKSNKEKA